MLFGCDIAKHRSAIPADQRRANARGNVVIARCNIGGQGAKSIEGRFVAMLELHIHIFCDQLHGHVAWAFDHDLHVVLPGHLGELTQGF